jgi:rare lipoprotein A
VQILKDESQVLAAQASLQGGDNVGPKPVAAPSGTVSATPLPPAGQSQPAPNQVASAPTQNKSVIGQAVLPKPDGQVLLEPVSSTSIYIQAGAFTQQTNAQVLSSKLSAFGQVRMTPVQVGSQLFYRVRLGPLATVDQADQVLQQVIHAGQTQARIVVD